MLSFTNRLTFFVLFCALLILCQSSLGQAASSDSMSEMIRTDVLVVGSTPCGISAAITAARAGSRVLLTDQKNHMGGMMTSGLGRTDIGPKNTVGGVFREFVQNIRSYYVEKYGADSQQVKDCVNGYFFEPSVAEIVLNRMVKAEKRLSVRYNYLPDSALMYGDGLHGVTFVDTHSEERIQIRAGVYVDATYEGDIAALAGVPYRIGRESREEQGEPYAGVLYLDHLTRMVLPGSTGKGDRRVQAYNFRLTLTKNPENRVTASRPYSYNRSDYLQLLDSVHSGRVKFFGDVIETRAIPNGKYDANNMPLSLLSTDLPGENYGYPEATNEQRASIVKRHRDYTLGLLYFLQNDPEMPEKLREEAKTWGLSKDEYPDNDHFPRQIYVREARRIWGLYTFSAQDAMLAPGSLRTPIHFDSIACGGYNIDSHGTRKKESGHDTELEGFFWLSGMTQPYQIPYRIMVPQRVDSLLVPGAVSATHLGFGTLRMEPVWMAMGEAAGLAAHLARRLNCEPRNVPVSRLQSWLATEGQVLSVFSDIQGPTADVSEAEWHAMQFYGTRGFFDSYEAKPLDIVTRGTAAQWLMSAIRAGDFMTYYGPSVKHDGGGSTDASLAQLVKLGIIDAAGNSSDGLSAGELAAWLSRIRPWIDGAWGDTWTERVSPKDALPTVTVPENPDKPVTRAGFCRSLFEHFRGASPTKI